MVTSTFTSLDKPLEFFSRQTFLSSRDIYQRFIDLAVDVLQAEIGYLHQFNEERDEIDLGIWSGNVFKQCTTTHISHYPLDEAGIWADSVRQRRSVIHNDYMAIQSRNELPEGHFPIQNHLGSPVFDVNRKNVIAIMGIGNRKGDFKQEDVALLESFIERAWPIVVFKQDQIKETYSDRARLFKRQDPQDLLSEMIATMGRALELRDEYTNMHQTNVALICDKIAERLEMPEQQRFGLKLGASIHDIGKIGVPSEILTKPSHLHPAEFNLVKAHPDFGAQLFDAHQLPWPIQEMIAQHHERMDGTGYPKGLLGQSICIEARIIAVADTFDAVSTDRPYRFAPGPRRAMEILREGRGVKFDAYIVDILFEILTKDKELRQLYRM